jgi:hypothetical protein
VARIFVAKSLRFGTLFESKRCIDLDRLPKVARVSAAERGPVAGQRAIAVRRQEIQPRLRASEVDRVLSVADKTIGLRRRLSAKVDTPRLSPELPCPHI